MAAVSDACSMDAGDDVGDVMNAAGLPETTEAEPLLDGAMDDPMADAPMVGESGAALGPMEEEDPMEVGETSDGVGASQETDVLEDLAPLEEGEPLEEPAPLEEGDPLESAPLEEESLEELAPLEDAESLEEPVSLEAEESSEGLDSLEEEDSLEKPAPLDERDSLEEQALQENADDLPSEKTLEAEGPAEEQEQITNNEGAEPRDAAAEAGSAGALEGTVDAEADEAAEPTLDNEDEESDADDGGGDSNDETGLKKGDFFSSYDERLAQATKNRNGHWDAQPGESRYMPDDPGVKETMQKYGVDSVEYKDAVPNFTPFTKHESDKFGQVDGQVEIGHMNNRTNMPDEYGRRSGKDKYNTASYLGNYEQADMALAGRLTSPERPVTPQDIAKYRKENHLTWHECNDMKTMQLIPTEINRFFKHYGGTAENRALRKYAAEADPIEEPSEDEIIRQYERRARDN